MFEQDYIMRQIKEMVRAILKLLFNIDTRSDSALEVSTQDWEVLDRLRELADRGCIDEAEDALFELPEDRENLKTALIFYSYLNDKPDDFLKEHDFSRDEIISGIKDILAKYSLEGLFDALK